MRMTVAIVVGALVFSSGAFAAVTVDTSGLSEMQKLDLAQQAERMRSTPTVDPNALGALTPERVSDWAQLGKDIALAFTTVAKELGVAADQFLASTTGKVTLALIVWKVAGEDILHVVIGVLFLATFVPMWVYFFRRMCLIKSIVLEPVDGQRRRKKSTEFFGQDISIRIIATRWVMLFVLILIVSTGLLVAL